MSFETALAFVAALLVFVMVPGPAILMVVGRSLSNGLRSTVGMIFGILLGDVFYMLLVFLGLATLGQMLGESFFIVRILAAIYLIYLGIRIWRGDHEVALATEPSPTDTIKSFATGFGITLGNPKAILFHLGFLPTFFDLPSLSILDAVTIMALFLAVLGTAFVAYAYAASKAAGFFRNPRAMRILNRTSGTLLIGAGATVLLKRT